MDEVLPGIAARLSKDAGKEVNEGQVLTKWQLAKDVLPITYVARSSSTHFTAKSIRLAYSTSSKKERLINILETISLPDLTPEEVAAIDEAGKKIHHRVYVSQEDIPYIHLRHLTSLCSVQQKHMDL